MFLNIFRKSSQNLRRGVDRGDTHFMQDNVDVLKVLVEEIFSSFLCEDSFLHLLLDSFEKIIQTDVEYLQFRVIQGITREVNGLTLIGDLETDAWDGVEGVEELEVGTVNILLIPNNSWSELKQPHHEILGHP